MPPLEDEDSDLFRRSVGDIKRLRTDTAEHDLPRPAPAARFRRMDEAEVLRDSLEGNVDPSELETGDELCFRRPMIRPADFKRLRRGQFSVGSEIDLHGLTSAQAHAALSEFIVEASSRRLGCVRVIHGKGLRSGPGGPVIKKRIGRWLRQRDEVLAYASARAVDGGTGAIYVLLRKKS
jgi:DNA-nicking Smr family endonuclease